jgi:hypothetical protein
VIELRTKAGLEAARALARIKAIAWAHPGELRLAILIEYVDVDAISIDRRGKAVIPTKTRRLELGPLWGYSGSSECLAALSEFGAVECK